MMKKMICALLSAVLALSLGAALAEDGGAELLRQLENQTFIFASGVGAWDTTLEMGAEGAFTGTFHDSEMGDMADAYPNGTVYYCTFTGSLSDPVRADENSWTLRLALETAEPEGNETIEEGIRFVTSAPYGLENAETLTLFLPGTPVKALPEALLPWTHLNEMAPGADTLPFHVLWNAAEECGFVGLVPEG